MSIAVLDRLPTFPDPNGAEDSIGGLLAIGGDLCEARLLEAYRAGVFPWFENDGEPVLWWSPRPEGGTGAGRHARQPQPSPSGSATPASRSRSTAPLPA